MGAYRGRSKSFPKPRSPFRPFTTHDTLRGTRNNVGDTRRSRRRRSKLRDTRGLRGKNRRWSSNRDREQRRANSRTLKSRERLIMNRHVVRLQPHHVPGSDPLICQICWMKTTDVTLQKIKLLQKATHNLQMERATHSSRRPRLASTLDLSQYQNVVQCLALLRGNRGLLMHQMAPRRSR